MPDFPDFTALSAAVQSSDRKRNSIGVLSEKTLHAVCKNLYAPDMTMQEVRLGQFIADCFDGSHVTEIQTRSFYPLQKKLRAFLSLYPVNVVKPLIRRRTIFWTNTESGEISEGRKSPKTGAFSDILEDLFWLGELFPHEHLTVTVLLCDVADYRLCDGFGQDKKSHATRQDLIPTAFAEQIALHTSTDCLPLLPALPLPFTAKQFQKAAHMTPRMTGHALQFLMKQNLLVRTGKKGNAFLYDFVKSSKA